MMMQLGDSTATATATATVTTATAAAPTSDETAAAAAGPIEGAEEIGDRGFGGNRWPRQETLALLKIRSDMGIAFRDASVKGPLWEEISRKMAELGYRRSAKKCKEKFENVYKYHKRTKEGRTGKSDGKTYRFFEQLEALENQSSSGHHHHHQQPPPPPQSNITTIFSTPPTQLAATAVNIPPAPAQVTTVTSTMPIPNITVPSIPPFSQQVSAAIPSVSGDFLTDSTSSSSSTSSDVEIGGRSKKRKRKWNEFFERLMKQVVDKQEELQRRFLEAVEKREHDRMVREEAWRMQEIARINREREILAQERSMAVAKDAAVMALIQKLSENQNPGQSVQLPQPPPQPQAPPHPTAPPPPPPPPQPEPQPVTAVATTMQTTKTDNGEKNFTPKCSSRWPKVEIEALINLRTNLDSKYQENGPKGPLWEEISAGMRRLGYNRNAKRCKEKWENINKYFKKVKESNKKRPEDSKTCPYFHQLNALYREKNKFNFFDHNMASSSSSGQIKPENTVPLLVQPEQQWPPPPQSQTQPSGHRYRPDMRMENMEGENFGEQNPNVHVHDEEDRDGDGDDYEDDDDDDDDDDEEEEEEEEEEGEFEIVPNNNNKGVSLGTSG